MRTTEAPDVRVSQVRTRALLFLVLALCAGVGAVYMLRQYMQRVQSDAVGGAQVLVPIVVAAMDVPIATSLQAKHLTLMKWPANSVPADSYQKLSDVLNKTVRQGLVKGEPLLKQRVSEEGTGQGLAALLKAGERAMAVEVDALVGVAGFVQPGDFVDVITTMQPDDETHHVRREDSARVSKIVLQNVRVLAVGEQLTTSEGGKPVNAHVFTLAVDPAQSEVLALASQYGKIQLSLRSRLDQSTLATQGQTPARILAGATPPPPPPPAPEPEKRVARPAPAPKVVTAAPAPPPRPAAPVVEILRGTRVEERKLHSGTSD